MIETNVIDRDLLDIDLISNEEFDDRFVALHKQLFASTEYKFNDVTRHIYTPPKGLFQVDHSFFHDGSNWHMFYVTGDQRNTAAYCECFSRGDWNGAAENAVETGIGHAVGKSLFDLKFKENICLESQGDFDLISRSNGWVFEYQNRYGMLYGVRGGGFVGFSLAWSDDLEHWELDEDNPCISPPAWANPKGTCKDAHIMRAGDTYLIYYIVSDPDGCCAIALSTTKDWKFFMDKGCVFRSLPMLRGTMGIESPTVICRNGMMHLFFTYGPGLCHAVSNDATKFHTSFGNTWRVGTGFYCVGPFHATEIVQDLDGTYWLTTDRKEETRRLNREAGRLCYRGTYEDEITLEEGLYLSRITWNGDQPIFEKP